MTRYTRGMNSPKFIPGVIFALSLACGPQKGGGDSSGAGSSGGSETGVVTTSGPGNESGTETTNSSNETITTATSATVTTAPPDTGVDETNTTMMANNCDAGCPSCPDGCVGLETCVEGELVCECVRCGETTGGSETGETTGGEIQCGGEDPKFPEFDRTCASPDDCAVVFHQIDCCGSTAALGISVDASKPFAEAEAVCVGQFPACECAAQPPIADDGESAEDPAQIAVTCTDGQCQSFVQ